MAKATAIRAKQTQTEIIRKVAEQTGLAQSQVKSVLSSVGEMAQRHVTKGGSGEFSVPGLGIKVRRVKRKARIARNPMTGEPIRVPARTSVKATILKTLKEAAA